MHALVQHLRYTLPLLRKSPGFTITAVLILGFGIGINTAIFSLIDAAMLKPLPFPDPDRLVEVCMPYQQDMLKWADYPDYLDMAAAQHSFESLSVVAAPWTLDLAKGGQAEPVRVHFASTSLAKVTGLPITLGRWISEEADVPHGPLVAVLSEPFWRKNFQSDPSIVGKNITLSGWSFQVIGVAPVQVWGCGPPIADVYVPTNAVTTVLNWPLDARDEHFVDCLGRLKKGVSIAQAQADLETLHNNLVARYPDKDAGYGLRVMPVSDRAVFGYSQTIWLLGAAAGCLLLIPGANIANLLYARGVERRQEMSIRSALGGTRFRLLAQCLLETGFLSALGGTLGVGLALLILEIIKKISPQDIYRLEEVSIDTNALLFVSGVTLFIALFSGLLPAWNLSKTNVTRVLKADAGRTNTAGRELLRTQALMVVGQVAIACLLLVSAALLTRSFLAVQSVPVGFNPHQVLTAQITLTSAKYTLDPVRTRTFWGEVIKARQIPGVETAGMNSDPPLMRGFEVMVPFTVDGELDPGPERRPVFTWQMVSPDFFRAKHSIIFCLEIREHRKS
jgi:putative ABC transport system permease protein